LITRRLHCGIKGSVGILSDLSVLRLVMDDIEHGLNDGSGLEEVKFIIRLALRGKREGVTSGWE